jgi:hypothetical protein
LRTAIRIINAVRGIGRVVNDIASRPRGTVEWEEGYGIPWRALEGNSVGKIEG